MPPKARARKPRRLRQPRDENAFLPARPLALRLEGVYRAVVDPMPLILKLPARLRRAADPAAARQRSKPFLKPPRHNSGYARPTFRDLIETLEPLFANSS